MAWAVQEEQNVDKYEVEKSVNASRFTKAGSVGARNSGFATTYDWIDLSAQGGANYYYIKAVGLNGEVKYSRIVRIDVGNGSSGVTVYPNRLTANTIGLSVNLPKRFK